MNPRELTAKAVFDDAHEIQSPAERGAYLDQACRDAPELRKKVEALLRAHEAAGSFMQKPAWPLPATSSYQPGDDTSDGPELADAETVPPESGKAGWQPAPTAVGEGVGTEIGPYRLVRELGEGGMGAVYLAEQEKPIRRQVALKIIKPGMDSAAIVARFEAERQALTMMEHPNIAKVLDAGATATGRPFFVMELVKGVPMTRFCNDNGLTVRERLTLFVTVCQAVQHAHQKGIMHRDIKPGNVLVAMQDGKPTAKVIDFGLAKAIEQPLTDQSRLTQAGAIVGTLKYMSPEQADFNTAGIDTRTDIYSLGVMLYELLTGTTPLDVGKRGDLHGQGFIDMVLRIKEEEPPRPSTRISTLGDNLTSVAAERKTEPTKLAKLLRGELDWIVMKALEKDRNRRYETASGFAKDIERYLDDEPVEACPPSARYRLGKFARKHRALLATISTVAATLMVAVVTSSWLAVWAFAEQKKAVAAKNVMREGYDLADAAVEASIRNGTKMKEQQKEMLRKALARLPQSLQMPDRSEDTRATAATRQLLVANVRMLIEDVAEAAASYGVAIQLYEELAQEFAHQSEYRYELSRALFDLAILQHRLGERTTAEAALSRAIDERIKLVTDFPANMDSLRSLADNLNNLGVVFREEGDLKFAEKVFRAAVIIGEAVVERFPLVQQFRIDLVASYHNLGNAVRDQGDLQAALPWYGKAVNQLTPIQPRPVDATVFLRNAHWDRANALDQLERHTDAIQDWRVAIELDDGGAREHLRLFLAVSEMEVKLGDKPTGQLLYDTAALCARAAKAAADEDEKDLSKRYVQRSFRLLNRAKSTGWFQTAEHVKHLNSNKDFDLLPVVEFKQFVAGLAVGPPPE